MFMAVETHMTPEMDYKYVAQDFLLDVLSSLLIYKNKTEVETLYITGLIHMEPVYTPLTV